MSDVYRIPGKPFVHAYPITHRSWSTGLFYTESLDIGALPEWPPESQATWSDANGTNTPHKQTWHWYADSVGLDKNYIYFFESRPEYFAISDEWNFTDIYSERKDLPSSRFAYLSSYGWYHYDLRGIAGQVTRAEFVFNAYPSVSESENATDRNVILQIDNGITDYAGWRPSPYDFRTPSGASIAPPLTIQQVAGFIAAGSSARHRYWDDHQPLEYGIWQGRIALPINAQGLAAINRSGRVGIKLGMDGSLVPSDRASFPVDCGYEFWDANAGTNPLYRGIQLPTLRLWLGGSEAEVNTGLHIRAMPDLNEPRRVVTHAARQLRDK